MTNDVCRVQTKKKDVAISPGKRARKEKTSGENGQVSEDILQSPSQIVGWGGCPRGGLKNKEKREKEELKVSLAV